MTEKTFLKKIINKYSKKFESSPIRGLDLKMKAKEDLVLECDKFIQEEIEETIPTINYNDEGYNDYYKAKLILNEYFKRKEKIYNDSLLRLLKPKGHEGFNLEK